jgi:hypothetical protein
MLEAAVGGGIPVIQPLKQSLTCFYQSYFHTVVFRVPTAYSTNMAQNFC